MSHPNESMIGYPASVLRQISAWTGLRLPEGV